MIRISLATALTVALALAFAPLHAARAEAGTSPRLNIAAERLALDNGLEVILHHDDSLPLVAVNIWYHVGPVNEPPGRSGFAHLFEHLMFAGSAHVGNRFDQLLEAAGATNSNGTTSWDRTNYFETVPSEYLELVLWLESDRMGFLLDAIDQRALDTQRGVVLNERRQSYENSPYGPSTLALLNTLFPVGHPYHGAVIGSPTDIASATLADVRSFYLDYYAPSNATLVIAGDFDRKSVLEWLNKYFAGLRDRPRPAAEAKAVSPALEQPQRLIIEESVQLSQVAMGWVCPPAYTDSDAPLQIAAEILGTGRTSRLYRDLVIDRKVATEVNAWVDPNALGSIVVVSATVAEGVAPATVEAELQTTLEGLAQAGPTERELARGKRRLLLRLYADLQRLDGPGGESGRAGLLQRFNHYLGNPNAASEWAARIERVGPDAIKNVVARHLSPTRRATAITVPRPTSDKR